MGNQLSGALYHEPKRACGATVDGRLPAVDGLHRRHSRRRHAVDDLDGDGQELPGDLYVRLAVEYLRQGQTETALRKAGNAVTEDPDNPQAHNLMALIYQRLGRNRLAEQHFRKAVGLEPGDPYILNSLCQFFMRQAQVRTGPVSV